ncbi:nitroreductase family protein [Mahella sp.]|uniref:nitroreductase family protein n=1 Tax=Mahella sp. TaxID=2798721 RepID=UPI0025B93A10|nr:nitroreductase family protein [Mahella sp.]MBZ4665305.1 nitroreductase [Mahella sp.]MDK2903513.1 hypothetical protein [Clostridiales bacterium]
MDFYDVISNRRAVRRYKEGIINDEALKRIMEATRRAPSWANRQCWRFILIKDRETMMKLGQIRSYRPDISCYEKAGAIAVLCADPSASGEMNGKQYYMLDAGIAMEHLILAATAQGLGTCWIGAIDEQPIKQLLHIPHQYRVIAFTPIGYADEQPPLRSRLPLDEVFHINKW